MYKYYILPVERPLKLIYFKIEQENTVLHLEEWEVNMLISMKRMRTASSLLTQHEYKNLSTREEEGSFNR
jgi:hypothetical protein